MSSVISWLIIGLMSLSFISCGLFSYFGTTVSTAAQTYPRVEKVVSTPNSNKSLIRTGSVGSAGASILGGGPSSGK